MIESSAPEPATLDWLLAGDAAIRWQVKRDLLDAPVVEVEAERSLVATTGWGRRLLEHQDPQGTWANGLYGPKWTSTTYSLLLLRHCGLPPGDPRTQRGVELIWDGARYFDGGLTCAASIDAPEACVTSLYLALAYYFEVAHPNVAGALEWLLENQLEDGGWNCRTVRFGDRHSSFHTSISALEALNEAKRVHPDRDDIGEALAAGREFFLRHHLFKSHRDGSVANPAFTRLSFPPRWHYDLLRGLDHFAETNAPADDRYGDAVDVLRTRRRKDGTWPVQQKYAGSVWFDMERTGGPSRWNTLRALRVLRWHRSRTRPTPPLGSADGRVRD
ncbi:MAG: hypothetical protein GY708_13850 [Actinomycetia bacterium]|nr:hypothetical protein [Actinomycetes bacterium]